VSYEVNWEIRALDLAAGFLGDDPAGVAELWERVSRLTDEPRPPESFPYGSPDLRRLRAGRYHGPAELITFILAFVSRS
jgi:mRNA interferase RelE/StbE